MELEEERFRTLIVRNTVNNTIVIADAFHPFRVKRRDPPHNRCMIHGIAARRPQ